MNPTIKFYTDNAAGPYLGDAVVELPDAGLRFTVRLTQGRDGREHVSWPSSNGRFWVSGIEAADTARWSKWILEQFAAWRAGR